MELNKQNVFLAFNDFIALFYNASNDQGHFIYQEIIAVPAKRKFFLSSKKKTEPDIFLQLKDIIEFFQYFTGINRPYLLDYFFEVTNGLVSFYYIKNGM